MPPPTKPDPPTRAYSWYALGLLALINLLNYIDRNVIFALFEPIKRDLALTDSQLGWLGSAYIFVFSVAALPFGVLSDLRSRRAVIAGGVTVWSAFTFLSGLVNSFGQLFTCRALVGVGEAAFGPASSSLVADYFPQRGRAIAMGILSSGIALGGVLGLLLGGGLEAAYGWRVAFMTVGVPGFVCALMVSRLVDPTRPPARLTVRSFLRDFEIGVLPLLRNVWPLLAGVVVGGVAAWWLDRAYADSTVDIAVFSGAVGLGLALTFLRWVFRTPTDNGDDTVFGRGISGAFDDIARAGRTVLHTPTLVYIFSAGAMISFGLNGIVGWGPTFVSRELELSSAAAAALLGKWGLIAGTAGTIFGGVLADWLRPRYETARVIVVALGLLVGGPLALWLLTIRDPDLFQAVFAVAFFCLSWYNGPMTAVIFDVVPPRISATVAGGYLLFIHLAGDAIALPLVGSLSDRFGLDRAVLLLPAVVIVGGITVLGAMRTVGRDMHRQGVERQAA
ncbi:MAG TPA: MFS transporter [Gemmatimonadales bacterium]|nr:MFS transporter [Gemmatimonadales bacterium]